MPLLKKKPINASQKKVLSMMAQLDNSYLIYSRRRSGRPSFRLLDKTASPIRVFNYRMIEKLISAGKLYKDGNVIKLVK